MNIRHIDDRELIQQAMRTAIDQHRERVEKGRAENVNQRQIVESLFSCSPEEAKRLCQKFGFNPNTLVGREWQPMSELIDMRYWSGSDQPIAVTVSEMRALLAELPDELPIDSQCSKVCVYNAKFPGAYLCFEEADKE